MIEKKDSIDRQSVIPAYYQLQEILGDLIEEGLYKPDDRLPSENELCAKYGICRSTAQKALKGLVDRGMAYRIQGKGTFVANKVVTYGVVASLSYSAEMIGLNKSVSTELIHANEINASGRIARNLDIPEGAPVYSIQRLRFVDDIPMSLQTSYLPVKLVPGLIEMNFEENSLFKTIHSSYGLELGDAYETLQAVQATTYESKKLKIEKGAAVFLLERITRLVTGEILEFVKTILRGDKSKFFVELSKHPLQTL